MEKLSESVLYETLFILRPELGGKAKEFIERFKKIVVDLKATDVNVEEWGNRDLAYPIQKLGRGYFSLMKYRAGAGVVEELERNMKLIEGLMRFLTIRVEEEDLPEPKPTPKEQPQGAKVQTEEASKQGAPGP